tara:strand:- start:169 stop:516 length:348 start_codon:yes stop_codon:yes gene_type:complete
MSIKQFNNPTSGFRNLFNRAQKFDSTGRGVEPPPGPEPVVASGGAIAQYATPTGDVYQSHTFNNSGAFVVTQGKEIDILVVGGGGAGGNDNGGGGGAGALQYKAGYTLPEQEHIP